MQCSYWRGLEHLLSSKQNTQAQCECNVSILAVVWNQSATHALTKPTRKNCVPEPVMMDQPAACSICFHECTAQSDKDNPMTLTMTIKHVTYKLLYVFVVNLVRIWVSVNPNTLDIISNKGKQRQIANNSGCVFCNTVIEGASPTLQVTRKERPLNGR